MSWLMASYAFNGTVTAWERLTCRPKYLTARRWWNNTASRLRWRYYVALLSVPSVNPSTWLSIKRSRPTSRVATHYRSDFWAIATSTSTRRRARVGRRRVSTGRTTLRPPWSTDETTRGGKVRPGWTPSPSSVLPPSSTLRSSSTCSRFVYSLLSYLIVLCTNS